MTGTTGQNQPKDKGSKPAAIVEDERPSPPVDDSDGVVQPGETADNDNDTPPREPAADAPPAPTLSPQEARRKAIGDRFAKVRTGETTEFDGDLTKDENLYGKLGGAEPAPADNDNNGADNDNAPPAEEKLTLKVNGKTLERSVEEIAAQLEMTPDEVRANPNVAIKIAQKDIAASERLESAKRAQRDNTARVEDTGTRPEPPPAHQQEAEPGKAPAADQPPADSDISIDEAVDLIEQLQLEDPKVAAPKLLALVAKVADGTTTKKAQQTKADEALNADRNTLASGLKDFGEAHPEVVAKKSLQSAMIPHLDTEYREDLVAALVAEGDDEAEAREIVANAPVEMVRNAHQQRRIKRDPNVRQLDKAFLESAYGRLTADLGLPAPTPKQDIVADRKERKERLPHQPARASVPPAAPIPAKAPISRSSAVADMKKARGQKTSAS